MATRRLDPVGVYKAALLMHTRWKVVISLSACLPGWVLAQGTVSATAVSYTTWSAPTAEALAAHWGLTPEDVRRYNAYMAVEGRYFYAHLDPVMVLGLIETDPQRRTQYVKQYLGAERQRIEQQTSFAALAAEVQLKRFGLEKLVDFSTLPGAKASPGYLEARAQRHEGENGAFLPVAALPSPRSAALKEATLTPHPGESVAPAATTPTRAAPSATPQAGDTIDLLVDPDCTTACYEKLVALLKTPDVRIHVYGRGFKDNAAFLAWLAQRPSTAASQAEEAKRLEPRRFDALMFNGLATSKAPVALWRRQGMLVSRL